VSPNGSDRSPRRSLRRKLPQALAAGVVLATATGCSYEDFPRLGLPSPATKQGPIVISLWQGSWAAAMAVGVLVWGLIIWAVVFHRRSRTKVEVPPQTRYNLPIEALYTVVPLIIIAVLFYYTARDESDLMKTSKKPKHLINVVGFQWSWGFNYLENVDGNAATPATPLARTKTLDAIPSRLLNRAPSGAEGVYDFGTPGQRPTLYLPKGETVQFVLTSRDVIHSFWVPNFLFKLDDIPGRYNTFEITATKEGTFRGKCAELCGVDHSRMLFNVKVVSPSQYESHLKALRAAGQTGYLYAGVGTTGNAKNVETRVTGSHQLGSEHK
jgi:cytochrome c oxidase subunit II